MIKGIPNHHLQDEEVEGLSGDEIVEEIEAEDQDVDEEEDEPIEDQIQKVFEVNINAPDREEAPADDTDSIVGMSVDDVMDSIFQHMEDEKAMMNQSAMSSTRTIVTRQTSKFEAITDSEESSEDELERE